MYVCVQGKLPNVEHEHSARQRLHQRQKTLFGTESQKSALQSFSDTGWQRPIGCLIFAGHFPQKNTTISGSFAAFAERDLQLKASSASLQPWSTFS